MWNLPEPEIEPVFPARQVDSNPLLCATRGVHHSDFEMCFIENHFSRSLELTETFIKDKTIQDENLHDDRSLSL